MQLREQFTTRKISPCVYATVGKKMSRLVATFVWFIANVWLIIKEQFHIYYWMFWSEVGLITHDWNLLWENRLKCFLNMTYWSKNPYWILNWYDNKIRLCFYYFLAFSLLYWTGQLTETTESTSNCTHSLIPATQIRQIFFRSMHHSEINKKVHPLLHPCLYPDRHQKLLGSILGQVQ